ncbi:MAG: AraC family transcriptional regulator [Ruminococcaceae bacterium]|nr:AraC family transcriptional regulator [Oscillospiraceae bacterium]
MYKDIAYPESEEDVLITDNKPLSVTAAGNYKAQNTPVTLMERPGKREDYQIYYVADGLIHYFDEYDQEFLLDKGHLLIIRPGEKEKCVLHAEEQPEAYWVRFTGRDADNLLERYQFSKGTNVYYIGTSSDYQWIFGQMIRELQLMRDNYEEMLTLDLRQLFLISSRYLQERNRVGETILDEVEEAARYFSENYTKPISVEDYARERGITANWLTQNFRKITKYTPLQYIIRLRMTYAKNLIDNTKCTVEQIAAAVGYDNPLYFSRLFKKHTGMTTSEYKKRTQHAGSREYVPLQYTINMRKFEILNQNGVISDTTK